MNVQSPRPSHDHLSPPAWIGQVDALRAKEQFSEALAILLPLLKDGVFDVRAIDRASMCLFDLGDAKSAIGLMELMTQSWPNLPAGWSKLAMIREATGDKAGAIRDYRAALKLDPNLASGLHALYKLQPFEGRSQRAERLRKLSKSNTLAANDRALVFNTLGKIEHRAKRSKSAFRYYAKSKDALGGTYKPEAIDVLVDAQEVKFTPSMVSNSQSDGPRVIFVCGMPRSGTTLVENILLRHPGVGTIGESKALKTVVKAMRHHVAATDRGTGYWDWFGKLDKDEISAFRQQYFARAMRGKTAVPDVIIDKMPLNCLDIGAAQVLLPDARFVFLSRHPLDTALSNFSTCYSGGVAFSRKLTWIGHLTKAVYRSAQDYQGKLGDQLRVQSYAALVTQPEMQIRDLLQDLNLPWAQDCLSPEQNEGLVRTASAMQVREKINTGAIGKWVPFAQQLEPVVDALGGEGWITAWELRDQALSVEVKM